MRYFTGGSGVRVMLVPQVLRPDLVFQDGAIRAAREPFRFTGSGISPCEGRRRSHDGPYDPHATLSFGRPARARKEVMDRETTQARTSGPTAARGWMPRPLQRDGSHARALLVALALAGGLAAATLALLRPGAEGLESALDTAAVPMADWGEPWHINVESPLTAQRSALRDYLGIVAVTAGVLLLVGLSHAAVAVIARLGARRGEQAVRVALGAPLRSFLREIAGETWLLAAAAIGLAAAVAAGGSFLLTLSRPAQLFPVGWGWPLALLAVVAPATGISALALLASRHAWRSRQLLRRLGAGERATEDPRAGDTRDALIVIAFAASLVLLAGAGMLLRGAMPLLEPTRLGYDASDTLGVQVSFPAGLFADADERAAAQASVRDAVRALHGVREAGLATPGAWLGLGTTERVFVECGACVVGLMYRPVETPLAQVHAVGEGFFEALRLPLVEGRPVGPGGSGAVANEVLARNYFERGDPIGRAAWPGHMNQPARAIVGVVGDVHVRGLGTGARPRPVLYLPAGTHPPFDAWLAIRVDPGADVSADAIRSTIAAAAPGVDVSAVAPLMDWLSDFAAPVQWFAWILVALAAAALALATHGLHAVTRAAVRRRQRELGIRLAVGASPAKLTAHVLSRAARLAAFGCLFGTIGAVGIARTMQERLPGVRLLEPGMLAGLGLTLAAATLLGAWGPARSAARTDPAASLREE
jgi:putative ABC transport system permease protein